MSKREDDDAIRVDLWILSFVLVLVFIVGACSPAQATPLFPGIFYFDIGTGLQETPTAEAAVGWTNMRHTWRVELLHSHSMAFNDPEPTRTELRIVRRFYFGGE